MFNQQRVTNLLGNNKESLYKYYFITQFSASVLNQINQMNKYNREIKFVKKTIINLKQRNDGIMLTQIILQTMRMVKFQKILWEEIKKNKPYC